MSVSRVFHDRIQGELDGARIDRTYFLREAANRDAQIVDLEAVLAAIADDVEPAPLPDEPLPEEQVVEEEVVVEEETVEEVVVDVEPEQPESVQESEAPAEPKSAPVPADEPSADAEADAAVTESDAEPAEAARSEQ